MASLPPSSPLSSSSSFDNRLLARTMRRGLANACWPEQKEEDGPTAVGQKKKDGQRLLARTLRGAQPPVGQNNKQRMGQRLLARTITSGWANAFWTEAKEEDGPTPVGQKNKQRMGPTPVGQKHMKRMGQRLLARTITSGWANACWPEQ